MTVGAGALEAVGRGDFGAVTAETTARAGDLGETGSAAGTTAEATAVGSGSVVAAGTTASSFALPAKEGV